MHKPTPRTCINVQSLFHVSEPTPNHVPSSDRHTFPAAYKFGENRTRPPSVDVMSTSGGFDGYSGGHAMSNVKQPESYGVPGGPVMSARCTYGRVLSYNKNVDDPGSTGRPSRMNRSSRDTRFMLYLDVDGFQHR